MALLPFRLRLGRRPRVRAGRGVVLGRGVRFDVSPGAAVVLGDGCALGEHTRLIVRAGRVEIGPDVVIGDRTTIVAHAGVTIAARCVLGEGVVIVDFQHVFDDVERPIRQQGISGAPVSIGADARIGLGASILPGVTVGPRAQVAPRAVVTHDVPAGSAVEGVPARPIAAPASGRG
jgi:acetyltransferase-like isoleucine patch superfamily enzyme